MKVQVVIKRRLPAAAATRSKASRAGCVKGAAQSIVQGAQANLVAHTQGATGSNQMPTRSTFLVGDDRPEHAVNRRVQMLDHRMMLVQAAAVDSHHDLRPRRVQCASGLTTAS